MNYKNFWKTTLSFGLLAVLILPSAGLANAKTNALPVGLNLVRDKKNLKSIGEIIDEYFKECADWDKTDGMPPERLKKCVTVVKGIRARLDLTHRTLASSVSGLKNEKKWTQALDDDFEKNAAQRGVDAKTVSEIKGEGGFRASYEKNIELVQSSKPEIDAEIKALEARIEKKPAAQNQLFEKISFAPKTADESALPAARFSTRIFYHIIYRTVAAVCWAVGCD